MLGVYTFGSGECDQLGLGDDILERKNPTKIEMFKDPIRVYKIACGGMHTLVLTTRGQIYSFGTNDECTLGRTGQENLPGLVDLKVPMNGISCGDSHSIAYNTEMNVIYQWGVYKDKSGSMGQKITSPTEIDMSNFRKMKIKKVVSGDNHTLVLAGGYVYAWGNPESGQIGRKPHGARYVQQSLMIQRLGAHPVLDVFAGKNHNFIICDEVKRVKTQKVTHKIVRCWGHNHYGQLGLGHLEQSVFTQMENTFFRDKNIKHITGGESFTLVLTDTNELFGMGRNDDGQLGFENTQKDSEGKEIYTYPTPVKIDSPKLDQVMSASNYSYGLDYDINTAYSWGVGQNYVLGNKSDDDQKTIFKIPKEFFKNKILGQIGLGASHVVIGLYETEEKDKIEVPKMEDDYLTEYKKQLEVPKEKKKALKRKKIGCDDEESILSKGRKKKTEKKETKNLVEEENKQTEKKERKKSKSKSRSRSKSKSKAKKV